MKQGIIKRHGALFFLCLCLFSIVSSAIQAQGINKESKIGANLMNGIYIEAERPLVLIFKKIKIKSGQFKVKAHLSDIYDSGDYTAHPALLRVTGRPSEAMITIEADELAIKGNNGASENAPKINNFNLFEEGAGNVVYVRPSVKEDSFIVPIGGTVLGDVSEDKFYSGFNIVYVNFL